MVRYGKIIEKDTPGKNRHFMMISKLVLILTVCVYYALQMSIFIPMLGIVSETDYGDFNWALIVVLLVVAIVLGIVPIVFAVIGAVRNEQPHTMITVVVKTLMVPFFCINCYCWYCLVSGLLNPFLFLTIPGVILIGICVTYAFLLTTSLPDVIYMIIYLIKHKRKPKVLMGLGILFMFGFFIDLVGVVLIHRSYKEIKDS